MKSWQSAAASLEMKEMMKVSCKIGGNFVLFHSARSLFGVPAGFKSQTAEQKPLTMEY